MLFHNRSKAATTRDEEIAGQERSEEEAASNVAKQRTLPRVEKDEQQAKQVGGYNVATVLKGCAATSEAEAATLRLS